MITSGITYEKRDNLVVIKGEFFGSEDVLNKESCLQAIENVKKDRGHYYTEKAYQIQLKKFQDALKYFD